MKFDVLLDSCKTLRVPTDTQEAMLSCLLRHNKLFYLAGGALQPKHHSMLHLAQRSLFCGHPKSYHTYHDEAVHGWVKQIACSAHRSTFAETVLYKVHILRLLGRVPAQQDDAY